MEPANLHIVANNMVLVHEGDRVAEALRAAGIPCLMLKGVAFLDTLYLGDEIAERPMVDIDLLVPEDKFLIAHEQMLALGYRHEEVTPDRPATVETVFERVYVADNDSGSGTIVEIHQQLCQPHRWRVDHRALFERAVWRETRNRRVHTLSAEDSLLFVALHQAKDGFTGDDRRYRDIALIISRWGVDWTDIVVHARAWGLTRGLYVSLRLAQEKFAADVPHWVLSALDPGAILRSVIGRLLSLESQHNPRLPEITRFSQLVNTLVWTEHLPSLARFLSNYVWLRTRDAARHRLGHWRQNSGS